jgi:V8-like Glu-specific endopeptidase
VDLTIQDRQQLIALLQDIPELATERGRRQVLELADLKKLLPRIDLSDPPFTACNQIVSDLSAYGRLSYGPEALGVFLNGIKGLNLVGEQQQDFLHHLLVKYNMMTPTVQSPGIDDWHGNRAEENIYEKIIGENTLRSIAFLAQGLKVARSIAYIGVNAPAGSWSGTGFLIAPDLLLTNHHVLSSSDILPYAIFRFNYEENFKGEAQPVSEYAAKAHGIFHTNPVIDYSIVQLAAEIGNTWGWLNLQARNVKRDDRVNIIQHPAGRPKQISLQNNLVEYVGGGVVQYITATLPGSSGSPVFNDYWEVVALHHAGGNLHEPTTHHMYYRNEGILISRILADLPADLRHQISIASGI